ncbi:S24 family peptidase [Chryseobacterium gambrini]|uniref:S24 family peptidase n=1 Tax=Chryseobacterium gambrini TaxID=373672 RepID=UPI003D0E48C3
MMDNETLKRKTKGFYNYVKIKVLRNKDIVRITDFAKGNVSNYMSGKVNPSENFLITFEKSYEVNLEDYENVIISDKKEKAIADLNKIKYKSNKGSRLINDSELIPVTQYIVPIPGQAGLKKAFFAPDEYIEEHFEKETVYVKPSERAVYHKIEVDGDSMPGIVDSGDWARCEDIPKLFWLEKGTFKPNKVYCLFHRTKGILFKRISKTFLETITLSSDNSDKNEYPDEVFDLAEFSKILIVRVVEKRL